MNLASWQNNILQIHKVQDAFPLFPDWQIVQLHFRICLWMGLVPLFHSKNKAAMWQGENQTSENYHVTRKKTGQKVNRKIIFQPTSFRVIFVSFWENSGSSLELRGLAFDHPQCDVGVHLEAI